MSSLTISGVVFVCVFGGALLGLLLRRVLPERHLQSESKDIVRLGIGLVATMSALLLGLLVASAKSSYDTDKAEVVQMSAKIIFLDRVLASYGPDATESRGVLRHSADMAIDRMWPEEKSAHAQLDPAASRADELFHSIRNMKADTDDQKPLKSQALGIASDLGQMRWLLYEQMSSSISTPFLIVIIGWLTVIFISFGLFAPFNSTVIITLMVSALSVCCALFLILELDQPFDGLIKISSAPMRNAIQHLGQ